MPALSKDEFAALKADIGTQGVLVPVVIDEDTGEVIEGHHRLKAWTELRAAGVKVPDYPKQVVRFANDDDRVAFVVAANLFRRHLTREQRAEVEARLRAEGWSLRRIGEAVGVSHPTVLGDLKIGKDLPIPKPERVERKGGGTYPSRRPRPTIFVQSNRDAARAVKALQALGDDATGLLGLTRAEERARTTNLADQSVDAIVTDPPYDAEGVPLYEPLGAFALRVLKPGRLAVVYAGHLQLDREMELLARGGLTYMWHGVNVLNGLHTKVRTRRIFGQHRSVLLYSAGPYRPRSWLNDVVFAEGRGGPQERPLHPWQQALEPVRHWIRQVSEPGELVVDPFLGSGTTAVAAVLEGRRFIGCDIDPGCVETTRRRLVELAARPENDEAGA
jgi:site-specific DNA-methyltransferase (adenine-specific)